MIYEFNKDLEDARYSEDLVYRILEKKFLNSKYHVTNVANIKECYHKGDIRITDKTRDIEFYLDVKDDKTCSKTHNLLAEDKVFYGDTCTKSDGFMRNSSYDYVGYCSRPDNKLYIINFKRWKEVYKDGKEIVIPHRDETGALAQTTYGYLMSIYKAKRQGVIVDEISYTDKVTDVDFSETFYH